MDKGRLEAFSDGVIAIIITIMVLELKVPHGEDWSALLPLIPVFLSYVLSFVYLGIYWNNHHHMLQGRAAGRRQRAVGQPASALLAVADALRHRLDGREPFRRRSRWRSTASTCLARASPITSCRHRLIAVNGKDSAIADGRRTDRREGQDFARPLFHRHRRGLLRIRWSRIGLYVVVAIMWLVPDRRMERVVSE